MKIETGVKFVRLITGEDVISEVTEIEKDNTVSYMLNSPMKVVYMSGETGSLTITLTQWVFWRISGNQEFHVKSNDILLISNASEDMEDYYWNSLSYYDEMKEKIKKKEQQEEEAFFDDVEEGEDFVKNLLEKLTTSDKRKLH